MTVQLGPRPPVKNVPIEAVRCGEMYEEIRRLEQDLDFEPADLNWSSFAENHRYLRELRMANAGEHS